MRHSLLLWFALLLAAALVSSRPLRAQQPPADSAACDSTRHGSSSIVKRWLSLDHVGVALGPSVSVRRPGWTGREQVSPGIAGGFFRGAGFGSRGRAGLVPAFRFDVFPKRVSVVDTLSGAGNALGTIRMRALMTGVGWSQPIGQSASAVVTGVIGESFNSLASTTISSRGEPFDVATSPASIGDSGAWEVSGRIWHRLRPSTVILAGISYYRTRPQLMFSDGTRRASDFDTIRADIGIAFTIYRHR